MRLHRATAAAVVFALGQWATAWAQPLVVPLKAGLDLSLAGGPFGPGIGGVLGVGPLELGLEGHVWSKGSWRGALRYFPVEGSWRPFIGLSGFTGRLIFGSPEARWGYSLGGIGELGLEWAWHENLALSASIGWSEAMAYNWGQTWGRDTSVSGPLLELRLRWRPLVSASPGQEVEGDHYAAQ